MNAPVPLNEKSRLAAVESYEILDTATDETFERITRLASAILQCPISVISFVDRDRQWFKSHHGLDASETPRSASFCAHAILFDDVFVIEDATKDERFCNNPLVIGDPNIRFYAGAPLISPDGHKLGTLCTIDQVARQISSAERQVLRDLAAMVMNELELRRLAAIDCLTKAFSRQFFMDLTDREITRANRYKTPVSLLAIDVDNFKSFNDNYGHHAGDLALVHLVAEARQILRAPDSLGRLGGEEFAVLLPHTDQHGAQLVAQKLCAAISNAGLIVGTSKLELSISVGIAQLKPEGDNLTELLQRADRALYKAKDTGRNRVVLAEAV